MRIILDGMGGDNAPMEIVKGAVQAAKEIDHEIYIVGKEDLINEELSKYKYNKDIFSFHNISNILQTFPQLMRINYTHK